MKDPIDINNSKQPIRKWWRVLAVIFSLVYVMAISYIDFKIITPVVLPEDYCYYHTHEIPLWVELLYMNGASGGHPDGSLIHFFLLIILSVFLGMRTRFF